MDNLPARLACASLLCNNCSSPGACCENFTLSFPGHVRLSTEIEVLVALATIVTSTTHNGTSVAGSKPGDANTMIGLPFMPLPRTEGAEQRYTCTRLGRDGLCTDYENRPALCRSYKPLDDAMCAMHPDHAASMSKRPTEAA